MKEDVEGTVSNKQPAVTRHGIMRKFVCYEDILKKKKSLSRPHSVLDSLKSSVWTPASPPVLSVTGYDNPDDQPTVHKKCVLLNNLSFHMFCKFFIIVKRSVFSQSKTIVRNNPKHLAFHLWGNPAPLTPSRITLPVSEPPTM
jgi:hypothetical protein